MNETEYLEAIKLENETHRKRQREDHLKYIESVKSAMLDIQNQATENTLRANLVAAALTGYLANGAEPNYTEMDKKLLCRNILELTDMMIDMMEQ
jgi:hypothetical protein